MFNGFLIFFIGWLILFSLGFIARWAYFSIINAPKKIKNKVEKTIDNQIDKALERNPNIVIIKKEKR